MNSGVLQPQWVEPNRDSLAASILYTYYSLACTFARDIFHVLLWDFCGIIQRTFSTEGVLSHFTLAQAPILSSSELFIHSHFKQRTYTYTYTYSWRPFVEKDMILSYFEHNPIFANDAIIHILIDFLISIATVNTALTEEQPV